MGLFRRRPTRGALTGNIRLARISRRRPHACAACAQVRGLYVYADDGRNYCVACARDLWAVNGLQPAGRRSEDVTLEQLIQYEVGGQRAS